MEIGTLLVYNKCVGEAKALEKREQISEMNFENMDIKGLREVINSADTEILAAFSKRMEAVKYIGRYKRRNALQIEDTEREKKLIEDKHLENTEFAEYSKKLLKGLISLSKAYQKRALNIYLTGMSEEDKHITAQMLENETSRQAVDTDVIVCDRAEATMQEIFSAEGEDGFLLREHEALTIAAEHGGLIVETGAGIFSRAENAQLMRASGYIVFLDVPLNRLLRGDHKGDVRISTSDDVTRLYYERIVEYKKNADIILDPDAPDFAVRLIEFMREKILI